MPLPRQFVSSPLGGVEHVDSRSTNPVTNAGAALGRVLFYDVRLSRNDSVSCASCHKQEFGFSDTVRFNHGSGGKLQRRRTMALANARYNARGRFFWDERAESLEGQVLQPIHDSLEMGMPEKDLSRKLAATTYYPSLFAAAFGSTQITDEKIASALAQFVRSLVSSSSRFDAVFAARGAPDYSRITAKELDGSRLFVKNGCLNCHRTVAQFADKASNTGLDVISADSGEGSGRFKPASLRNIAVRPPYMHDGRFQTLREVVEFYSERVQASDSLDERLKALDGSPRRVNLTDAEIDALVAFLESLTDSAFLSDERYSNPFKSCRAP